MTPAERAARMADHARDKQDGPDPERFQVAREWWLVTKPGASDPTETFMCPPQTERAMREIVRPGCKVEAAC